MQIDNKSLQAHIKQFFAGMTDDASIIDLASEIQQALEKGHTAIACEQPITHKLISSDGKSGYITICQQKAGFRRYFNAETTIKQSFVEAKQLDIDAKQLKSAIENSIKWCGLNINQEQIDWQWQACLAALTHNRFVLDGGPGTGKTTTIIRLFLLYIQLFPNQKVVLAAPTGKAANRMTQSLNHNLQQINISDKHKEKLALQAKTIHRLLGYNPKTNKLKYDKQHPLAYDLIIIDEASMLDVSLAASLIDACKDDARLIFIGDKNQLPAVDAGNVFADLCELLNQKKSQRTEKGNLLNHYLQQDTQTIQNKPNSTNYVKLVKNYRFSADSVVATLCNSLIEQDLAQFKATRNHPNFHWHNPQNHQEKQQKLQQWFQTINQGESKDNSYMILCATNHGNNSVAELNSLAKQILHKYQDYAQNMPIIINKNDYNLDVYNGDISYLQKINNTWQAEFIIAGVAQRIQLHALNWQLAHAISIHKSQGSEYDHVLITLSDNTETDLLTNALLYTAISRAKKSVSLWASDEIIAKTLKNQFSRLTFIKPKSQYRKHNSSTNP